MNGAESTDRNLIDRLREGAGEAFADEPVLFAYLFGSHARGRARADSEWTLPCSSSVHPT